MVTEFKLPDLGEGVAEGEIVKWLVKEGQEIKEDEPMVEVMTDKATVQIPSPTSGTVKQILAKEGQTVKVGTNLVILDSSNGQTPLPNQNAENGMGQQPSETRKTGTIVVEGKDQSKTTIEQRVASEPSQRVVATPVTRKLARDLGVDIGSIRGTGPGGRITEDDVKSFAATGGKRITVQTQQFEQKSQNIEPKARAAEAEIQRQLVREQVAGLKEERVTIHGIRKRIAEKMLKSALETASVTHVDEVDFTELVALREATKSLAEAQEVKLTFLPFIIKAVVSALKEFEYFNASIDTERQEFVIKHYYNIGVATDTQNGLIVPVVKDCDTKNIFEIAREIERLSEDARLGKIQLQDLQGGTFTITNIGTLGGVISTPIINVPEVAILGIHRIQKKPVILNNEIAIRDVAFVALTFDHRIVDGANAARFTTKLRHYLEHPSLIFVEDTLHRRQG